MKQVKSLSPETAAIFFSVDAEANKIVVLAAAPKVLLKILIHCFEVILQLVLFDVRVRMIVVSRLTNGSPTSARCLMVKVVEVQVQPKQLVTIPLV